MTGVGYITPSIRQSTVLRAFRQVGGRERADEWLIPIARVYFKDPDAPVVIVMSGQAVLIASCVCAKMSASRSERSIERGYCLLISFPRLAIEELVLVFLVRDQIVCRSYAPSRATL